MKLLHVIPRLSVHDGGPPQAVRAMARSMAENGHQVWIYSTDWVWPGEPKPDVTEPSPEGRARIRFFPLGRPRSWLRSPLLARALREHVGEFDLVIIHALYHHSSWAAAREARRQGVPYVIRPLGSLDPYIHGRRRWKKWPLEWGFQRRDLRCAAALQFTTEEEMRLAVPASQGARAVVLPLGVWADEFAGDESAGEPGWQLLYLGRIHPKKGLEMLVDSFHEARRQYPEIQLIIAGSGQPDYEARIRSRVRELGLDDCVHFPGFVAGEQKKRLLAEADLFVLPSHSENFGIAVIEAAAAGLPLLVSRQVNLSEAVCDAGAGWVVEDNPDAVAEGLLEVLAEHGDWPRKGQAGRAMVKERFDWPQLSQLYEATYRQIIS